MAPEESTQAPARTMVADVNSSTKAGGTFPSADEEMGLSDKWRIQFDGVHDKPSGSNTVSFESYDANVGRHYNRQVLNSRSHPVPQGAPSYRTRPEETTRRISLASNGNYRTPHGSRPDLDLVLAMERTLFAALNNAWLLALGGVGLMSVGNGDARAIRGGAVIIIGAIISAVSAMVMHATRITGVSRDRTAGVCGSVLWTFLVVSLTLATLALELNFGITYPYLEREQAVTIVETAGNGGT